MSVFKIQKQTEAEKDRFLIDCFHDAGFADSLINSNFSIVSGRKGTGKTALARYLEQKGKSHGVDLTIRISIRDISLGTDIAKKNNVNSILLFIIIKTVKKLLEQKSFDKKSQEHWKSFLTQNGLQQVSDYGTFFELEQEQKTGFGTTGTLSLLGIGKCEGEAATNKRSVFRRPKICNNPTALLEALVQSLPKDKKFLVFLDDVTDYLDASNDKSIKKEIAIIQDLLLRLEVYNSILADSERHMRFISLVREDLFEYMEGSNVNKLKSDSLQIEWNEESFASLLIRRLPFFEDSLEDSLATPKEALKKEFPDAIFSKALTTFNTNRYATNFYAYMVAISFNRPRDFLKFCYAMRDRLSLKHEATFENIESAEIEYSDYFTSELRDELFLASRVIGFSADQEKINDLIDILSRKNGFNQSELRTELAQYLGEKTSLGKKKIEAFIKELWWYGLIGFKEEKGQLISFRYIAGHVALAITKLKEYTLFLHRGLWWFSQKRKK